MRRTIALALVITSALSGLGAGAYNDVSLTFGHQSGLQNLEGLNVTYGLNVGLTKRLETSLWGESSLTPGFFQDNALGLSLSYAVMGDRSTGTSVPGSAINMFVNAGLLFTMHNPWDVFMPTTGYVSFTPLTLGSSVLGRRERMFEVGVAYNWAENRFAFFFSLFKFDYYVHGTWRDYM